MTVRTALVATVLAAASAGVLAQSAPPRVDARQAYQAARIDHGVASGALTAREAARLDAGQVRVGRIEGRVLADGTVTGREQARLEQAQDVQSRRIHRQKHDPQVDRNHDGRADRATR